ncbi:MAG: hypothetical protein R3D35_05275 [Nitratireductor sp.]
MFDPFQATEAVINTLPECGHENEDAFRRRAMLGSKLTIAFIHYENEDSFTSKNRDERERIVDGHRENIESLAFAIECLENDLNDKHGVTFARDAKAGLRALNTLRKERQYTFDYYTSFPERRGNAQVARQRLIDRLVDCYAFEKDIAFDEVTISKSVTPAMEFIMAGLEAAGLNAEPANIEATFRKSDHAVVRSSSLKHT